MTKKNIMSIYLSKRCISLTTLLEKSFTSWAELQLENKFNNVSDIYIYIYHLKTQDIVTLTEDM